VRWLALILGCLAVAAWAAWNWADKLPAPGFFTTWMPHFGTDFLIIAFTLVVIDQIQARQDRQPKRFLVAWIWNEIGGAIDDFALAATYDYTQTHVHSYKPPPTEAVGSLSQWAEGLDTEDNARVDLAGLVLAAKLLRAQVSRERLTRELDCPDLTLAIERYIQAVDNANLLDASAAAAQVHWLLQQIARAALVLAEIYKENATYVPGISEGANYSAADYRRQEMLKTESSYPENDNRLFARRTELKILQEQRAKEQREAR
jgi:hypothetical protein